MENGEREDRSRLIREKTNQKRYNRRRERRVEGKCQILSCDGAKTHYSYCEYHFRKYFRKEDQQSASDPSTSQQAPSHDEPRAANTVDPTTHGYTATNASDSTGYTTTNEGDSNGYMATPTTNQPSLLPTSPSQQTSHWPTANNAQPFQYSTPSPFDRDRSALNRSFGLDSRNPGPDTQSTAPQDFNHSGNSDNYGASGSHRNYGSHSSHDHDESHGSQDNGDDTIPWEDYVKDEYL
ncbi:hypothetical protein F4819DRAFT_456284 [Hypoxylon fuscum]|nr:hypothetical protein F4819DRAFT_456284 [Hypoxylon fuscum]